MNCRLKVIYLSNFISFFSSFPVYCHSHCHDLTVCEFCSMYCIVSVAYSLHINISRPGLSTLLIQRHRRPSTWNAFGKSSGFVGISTQQTAGIVPLAEQIFSQRQQSLATSHNWLTMFQLIWLSFVRFTHLLAIFPVITGSVVPVVQGTDG